MNATLRYGIWWARPRSAVRHLAVFDGPRIDRIPANDPDVIYRVACGRNIVRAPDDPDPAETARDDLRACAHCVSRLRARIDYLTIILNQETTP